MTGNPKKPSLAGSGFLGIALALAAGSATAGEVKPIAGHDVGILGAYGYDLTELLPGGSGNPNDGELVMGNLRNRAVHEGVTFLFASAESARKFEEDPGHWLPGGGGYCLLGLYRRAVDAPHKEGMPPPGDPAARTFANGKWFFHGGAGAEDAFEEDPDTIDERARQAADYFNARLAKQVTDLSGAHRPGDTDSREE